MSKNVTDQLLVTLVSRQDAEIALEMKRAQDVDDDISSALTFAIQAALYLSRARGTKVEVEVELEWGWRWNRIWVTEVEYEEEYMSWRKHQRGKDSRKLMNFYGVLNRLLSWKRLSSIFVMT